MGIVPETLHQLRDVGVQHRVQRDFLRPAAQLVVAWQFTEQNQVRRLEKVAVFGELFDGVATVEQDALVAVDEGDAASARSGVHERRVVGHHAELVGGDLDLAQIHGADGAVLDRNVVLFAGSIVGDRQRIGHAQV